MFCEKYFLLIDKYFFLFHALCRVSIGFEGGISNSRHFGGTKQSEGSISGLKEAEGKFLFFLRNYSHST